MSRNSYHSNHKKRAFYHGTELFEHSKKGVYCPQAGKHKLCYETEKKAQKAIRFNKDRTERYYWCQSCCSYHTTSKPTYVTSV